MSAVGSACKRGGAQQGRAFASFRWFAPLLILTLAACNPQGAPSSATVDRPAPAEAHSANCAPPALPEPGALPAIAKLPDPFVDASGQRIASRAQWPCLRQQTLLALQRYESGDKPPRPEAVSGSVSGEAIQVSVGHNGQQITFSAALSLPPGGQPPYPAMIGIGSSTLDNAYLASQGIALISLDNNAIGAQMGPETRGSGLFFDVYGSEHSASSMTAWAWGVSRLIDVIEADSGALIDPAHLGLTGCSRNGKGALLAAALDQRIALTVLQEAGAGGAVSWRVAQARAEQGVSVQTLANAAAEQPWFTADFGANFGGDKVARLPFDHHQVLGLIAPRGLLIIDNDIDWLGPQAGFVGATAAQAIYSALGVPDNIGYSENGEHAHCQFPSHQLPALSAFVQRFLLDQPADTKFMRSTQGDAGAASEWIDWRAPVLE